MPNEVNAPVAYLGQLHMTDRGAATQDTNHATGVTVNALTGIITLTSTDLAAGVEATFTVTNSKVSANDIVLVQVVADLDSSGTLHAFCSSVAAGSFTITLTNLHASGGAGNDASRVGFVVIKGP